MSLEIIFAKGAIVDGALRASLEDAIFAQRWLAPAKATLAPTPFC